MATTVRVSPLGIFCFVCVGFIILYSLKNFMLNNSSLLKQYTGEEIPIKRLLETSIYLAEKGGRILKDIREKSDLQARSKGQTLEGANDPLTAGDMESHKAIVHGFHHLFPLVTVVSEEHDHGDMQNRPVDISMSDIVNISDELHSNEDEKVLSNDILIWVDPLDATQEYTENLTKYVTTMVCIVVKGVPIAGVIHQPFLKKTFWAWMNHGHSKHLSKPLANEASLTTPRIIVSRSHAGSVNETAKLAFGKNVIIIPAGGAGFKVLSLFNGIADAYVHKTLIKRWDICAGDAILRSFGGKMTTLYGTQITYGEQFAVKNSGGLLATLNNHEHFLEKLSLLTSSNPSNKKT